jgi:hypothetical protein
MSEKEKQVKRESGAGRRTRFKEAERKKGEKSGTKGHRGEGRAEAKVKRSKEE